MAEFVIYSLAVWRIARLMVSERGPFDIFLKLRELTGIRHDQDGNPVLIPDKFFPQIFSCLWCSSIWVSAFWVLVITLLPASSLKLAMIFAFSAGAILIEKWLDS